MTLKSCRVESGCLTEIVLMSSERKEVVKRCPFFKIHSSLERRLPFWGQLHIHCAKASIIHGVQLGQHFQGNLTLPLVGGRSCLQLHLRLHLRSSDDCLGRCFCLER